MNMEGKLGVGAILRILGGNESTVTAVQSSLGKTIKSIRLAPERHEDGCLAIDFTDGTGVDLFDSARSCCEHRYMNCDDDLPYYGGAKLLNIELREGPQAEESDDYGEKEVMFLVLTTDRGNITVSNHNDHNGYYGGIYVNAELRGDGEI